MQYKAFIGIGSNLGIPAENCEQAIRLLHTPPGIEVIARSSLYESEPVGKIEQDWFVNTAVAIRTSLTPEALLNALFKI
ncbi:MAG: 2-amino-4-hydroxy-6-hydroxymethyldihydropteridine diphosphokinase, partial [Nitrospina sp.]|nr:2-amino-4-hydroxy-6-hydroxymethyldihydropteridine diphosphokinase [Nitrospina sp.]MBT6854877.1 2-amino-4-hydroxy-6-hydroxymethyldihydropteridine diphosphokinase [Nitrospina sp.]